jgi:hypothetical protein
MAVDHLSLATSPVILFRGDTQVSQGTGFFYAKKSGDQEQLYLITNLHVLTGHSPLEQTPPLGDCIHIQLHRSKNATSILKTIRIPLFTVDGLPVWICSRNCPQADLAAIPLLRSVYEDCAINCISDEWIGSGGLKVRPTSLVTLIGYPYGFYDRLNALPIWKTGSLASEPDVDFNGEPLLTIDISAFPGMSGSPAFAIAYGTYETETGSTNVGNVQRFLGIYASMQMLTQRRFLEEFRQAETWFGVTHSESLQLGHVWKARLIDELISSVDFKEWNESIANRLRS